MIPRHSIAPGCDALRNGLQRRAFYWLGTMHQQRLQLPESGATEEICGAPFRGIHYSARLIAIICLVQVVCWPRSGWAAVIEPGREPAVTRMVQEALSELGIAQEPSVSIHRDTIDVWVDHNSGRLAVRLGNSQGAQGVKVLSCSGNCEWNPQAISDAFVEARDRHAVEIWSEFKGTPNQPGRYRMWGVLLAALLWGAWRSWSCRRLINWRVTALGAALLAGFSVAAWFVASPGTLHDHNSFVARADCALSGTCVRDPRGAWSLAALDGFGLILRILPYSVHNLSVISLALTLLTLALGAGVLSAVTKRGGHLENAPRAGLWVLALASAHPGLLRVAVAESMWPYATACLLAAGLCALDAARHRLALGWGVSFALLGTAVLSNFAFGTLVPLVVIAPVCWRSDLPPSSRVVDRVRGLMIVAVCMGAFAWLVAPMVRQATAEIAERPGVLNGGIWLWLRRELVNQLYLDWQVTPVALTFFALFGLTGLRRRSAVAFLPLLYAFAAFEFVLANQVSRDQGYPTRYLHGYPSLIFGALAVGVGVENALELWRRRRPADSDWLRLGALVVCLGISWSLASEGRYLLRFKPPIANELEQLSSWFPSLPVHSRLVIAPTSLPPEPVPGCRSDDPVEVFFPIGEYLRVLDDLRRDSVPVIYLDDWLSRPASASATTLFYVGTALQSFVRCDVQHGRVPNSLAHPLLARLRERCQLVPVLTAEMGARTDVRMEARLGGDKVDRVTLGFYRCQELAR